MSVHEKEGVQERVACSALTGVRNRFSAPRGTIRAANFG